MKRLLIACALMLAGCTSRVDVDPPGYYHDAAHHVSCWTAGTTYGGSISCLPDSQVFQP